MSYNSLLYEGGCPMPDEYFTRDPKTGEVNHNDINFNAIADKYRDLDFQYVIDQLGRICVACPWKGEDTEGHSCKIDKQIEIEDLSEFLNSDK